MMSEKRQPGPSIVLVVDDEPAVLLATKQLLGISGFEVHGATSATEALALLARLSPRGVDVVISDYRMPGEDGVWLLGRVGDEYPSVARILYTGAGCAAELLDGITLVMKPATPEALVSAILGVTPRFD